MTGPLSPRFAERCRLSHKIQGSRLINKQKSYTLIQIYTQTYIYIDTYTHININIYIYIYIFKRYGTDLFIQ